MEVSLAVLADFASVSQEGKVNVMGVFQEINAPVLPWVHPQMFVVVTFVAGAAEFDSRRTLRIVFSTEDGKAMATIEQQVTVPRHPRAGERSLINQIVGLAGLRFERPGNYQFAILVDGDEKRTIPLRVHPPPQAPPTQ